MSLFLFYNECFMFFIYFCESRVNNSGMADVGSTISYGENEKTISSLCVREHVCDV